MSDPSTWRGTDRTAPGTPVGGAAWGPLEGFARHLFILVVVGLASAWLLSLRSFGGLCACLALCFTIAAAGACSVAIARGETPALGALNAWHESLALTAFAALIGLLPPLYA